MDSLAVRVTSERLDPARLGETVGAAAGQGVDGALVTFLGTVRGSNLGRQVLRLEYEAYEPLALEALERIVREARELWPAARLGIHHRTGPVEVGEASVAVVAAAPHRAEAFAACRYAIERVKQIVPIWKRECFEDGEAWVEGATADPDDAAARAAAVGRACGLR